MILAELNVRHTRRHMPTRRVALGDTYLPTSGQAYGAVLLGAVVSEFAPELDEEQLELVPRLLHDAREGISVPRIALRYRLQTDTHGLDRSRHRIVAERDDFRARRAWSCELDRHGRADPQVIGAVSQRAALPPSGRSIALQAITAALREPRVPVGMRVRATAPRRSRPPPLPPGCAALQRPARRRVDRHPGRPPLGDGGARPARRDARRSRRRASALPQARAPRSSRPRRCHRPCRRAARRARAKRAPCS